MKVSYDCIEFSNGSRIEYHHNQDCCERNYADFKQIELLALKTGFCGPITIEESSKQYGFRFGNSPSNFFYIPCYSGQNGYYSKSLDVQVIGGLGDSMNDKNLIIECECDAEY